MRNVILTLLSLLFVVSGTSNANDIDSLYQSIKKENDISLLPSLIYKYEQQLIQVKDWNELAKGYFLFGYKYRKAHKESESDYYYNKCISAASKVDNYTLLLRANANLGRLNYGVSQFLGAERYYSEALKLAIKHGTRLEVANFYRDIGLSQKRQYKESPAIGNFREALAIYNSLNKLELVSNMWIEIGICHRQVKKYQEANDYYYKALAVSPTSLKIRAKVLNNDSYIKWLKGETDEAIVKAEESLKLKLEIGKKSMLIPSYVNLGIYNYALKEYDKSAKYFSEAFRLTEIIDVRGNEAKYLTEASLYLDSIRIEKNKPGYDFIAPGIESKIKTLNLLIANAFLELDVKERATQLELAESTRKQTAIEKERRIIYTLSFLLCLILIGVGIFFRIRWKQAHNNFERENEKRASLKRRLGESIARHFT